MSDNGTLSFTLTPDEFEKVRHHFLQHGVKLPDEAAGEIYQKGVRCAFTFDGRVLRVTVIDKPWLVTQDYVEGKLREFIEQSLI